MVPGTGLDITFHNSREFKTVKNPHKKSLVEIHTKYPYNGCLKKGYVL